MTGHLNSRPGTPADTNAASGGGPGKNGANWRPRHILVMFAILALVAVALGFYVLRLKRKVAREAQATAEQQVAMLPPGKGPPEPVMLYVANDSDGTLRKTQVQIALPAERSERARAVLQALLTQYLYSPSPHPLGAGSEIRQVYLMGDDTAIVDTSPAFAETHPSGVLAEELTVASLVVTLNANDNKIARVKILVNGQERDTLAGHADLRRFYEAGNLGQVVKDMQ